MHSKNHANHGLIANRQRGKKDAPTGQRHFLVMRAR